VARKLGTGRWQATRCNGSMDTYVHYRNAGNFGDVVKHVVLAHLLQQVGAC
jgi:hypothetical protein